MKKVKKWLLLTIGFYLAFLLFTLPAEYVLAALMKRHVIPSGKILISGVEGSWANGSIQTLKFDGAELNNLAWSFRPSGLAFGRLNVAVACDIGGGAVNGIFGFGINDIKFNHFNGNIQADYLGKIYSPAIDLAGVVKIDELELILKNGYLGSGAGQVVWQDGAMDSPFKMVLGESKIDLLPDDEGMLIKFSQQGEEFSSNGLGLLATTGNYTFDGSVNPKPGQLHKLPPFLQVFGLPDSSGAIKIEFKGKIPPLR